ncbi:hypothetical protein V3C99_001088 [Haemonchus contortus]
MQKLRFISIFQTIPNNLGKIVGREAVDVFVNKYSQLPHDAKLFLYMLMHAGSWATTKFASAAKTWDELKFEFRNEISKSSCSKLLEAFPKFGKYAKMFVVFGVLLLMSSVLSENNTTNTVLQVIKEATGIDRNDLGFIQKFDFPKKGTETIPNNFGKIVGREVVDAFVKKYSQLPYDAKLFLYMLMHAGSWATTKFASAAKTWDELKFEFRNEISKSSCSKLLEAFPKFGKYGLCIA